MPELKKLLKSFIPPIALKIYYDLKKDSIFWEGNYQTWEEANLHTSGYDSELIISKVLSSTKLVIAGEAKYERDSVTFDDSTLNYPFLSSLFFSLSKNPDIEVADFGGALGSLYFQHKNLFSHLKIKWKVIEQENYVKVGRQNLQVEDLTFHESIEDISSNAILVISSVLQYLESPYDFLDLIISKRIRYIFIDRTSFNISNEDRITIQKVPSWIYSATYPCWFFSEEKILNKFKTNYTLKYEFPALDQANIPSIYKGFFFELNP